MTRALILLSALTVLGAPSPGRADSAPGRHAALQEVRALLDAGRGAEAETLRLATAVAAASPGDGPSHRLLGQVLYDAGRYREALRRFQAAAAIDARDDGPASAAVAEDLERAALACVWLDRHAEASAAIDRAVRIEEGRPDGGALARVLVTRAFIEHRRGRYDASESDLARALAIRQRLGLDDREALPLLTALGDQLFFDSDMAGARARLAEAVALGDRTLRDGHPALAEPLRLLALALDELGELDAARAARERALRIAAAAYGVEHPQYAPQLHDLALSFMKRGDYREARRLLEQARRVFAAGLGPTHSEIGSTLHNLGVLAASLGDFREAERLQARAEAIWARAVGPSHAWVQWARVSRAEALASQGRHAAALVVLRRTLAARERVFHRDHVQVAATLNAQARSLIALGRLAEARPVIDRAIAIWEAGEGAEGLSDALLIRARLEDAGGEHAAARADYERALLVRLPVFGASHPSVGDARVGLALTQAALGHTEDALALALDGERIGREHIRLTAGYLPESQALGYAASRARGVDLALSVARSPDDVARAFDAVIRGRALVQDEIALRQRLRASAAGDALTPLWAGVANASRRLANLSVRGPGGDEDHHVAAHARLLDRARREKADAEAALAEHSVTARRELARREVGLDELRDSLPAGSALVAFVRYDAVDGARTGAGAVRRRVAPAYAAFVQRAGAPAPALIRLGAAAALDRVVRRWRESAVAGVTAEGEVAPGAEAALRAAGAGLRQRIWDPLRAALGDAAAIYIVPDGALNLVPFGALPVDRRAYLVDHTPLHYLSAERDLAEYTAAAPPSGKGLFAVGGPAYGAAADGAGEGPACGSLDSVSFAALPASRLEAQEVGALWQRLAGSAAEPGALVLTGARADEGAFKRSSPGHRILHLATHGFFLGGDCTPASAATRAVGVKDASAPRRRPRPAVKLPDNPLLRSGLALAGANRRALAAPDGEDGILTAEEVAALDFDGVEWAVLSACETGLGEIRGGEGVFGLRRAFRTAGARTVIMSLWPVEDRATRVWMRALYRARLEHRRSTSEAMRDASLAVLGERRAKRLSTHPFYWAGFVAAGDWR